MELVVATQPEGMGVAVDVNTDVCLYRIKMAGGWVDAVARKGSSPPITVSNCLSVGVAARLWFFELGVNLQYIYMS